MSERNQSRSTARSVPIRTTFHMCLDVRGVLTNWKARQLTGMFKRADGKPSTAEETRAALLDALAAGKTVLPLGKPCEGFDYTTGCPGHEADEVFP